MALYLTEEEVSRLITMPEAMEAVDAVFKAHGRGSALLQPRRRIFMPKGTLHVMYAGVEERGVVGLKAYTTFPGIGVRFLYLQWNAHTAELMAVMEASILGQIRTGAASGVAARYMAREDAESLGLIGTGFQARTQLQALAAARPLRRVKVYGRDPERRKEFCDRMAPQMKAEFAPVGSASEAVRGSDIVCTITTAREPVFSGEDLEPGTTVIAAGSNRPDRREVDDETMRRAARGRIITDSVEGAQVESGDLILAVANRAIGWGQVHELGAVATGRMPGRGSAEEVNLFVSQGVAIEDVALGAELYRRAKERGVGKELPF
ncbi:MAG: ornithine cyclodeaminase family protein [Nitrospinota bacterium]